MWQDRGDIYLIGSKLKSSGVTKTSFDAEEYHSAQGQQRGHVEGKRVMAQIGLNFSLCRQEADTTDTLTWDLAER